MEAALATAREEGLVGPAGEPFKRSRERDELEAKLRGFGLTIPWSRDAE
jgi:hypothetical protein